MNRIAPGNFAPRRVRALVGMLGTTQLHLRNPYIVALWSAIFPGLGHFLLGKYISGFLFFGWEIVINFAARLNESIFYSFTLQFDLAKRVLDGYWLMLYIPTYLFAIWDSYRTAADLNNQFVLAEREDADIRPFAIHPLGVNYLDKSPPWTSFVWSALSPGAGQLSARRAVPAYFFLIGWILVLCLSRYLPAVYYTLLGQFENARAVADRQWALNIPSLYFFAIYDAYVNTVESNKLFDWEQARLLKREYQSGSFPMPFKKERKAGDKMYILSTFEHGIKLETAITAIETKGIPRGNILAVPVEKSGGDRALFDRMHYSDGLSMFDLAMIFATTFSLLGLIYGFLLYWGPVIWALIGTGFGTGVGVLVKLCVTRKHIKKKAREQTAVVLLVACEENQTDMVRDALLSNFALGVSELKLEDA